MLVRERESDSCGRGADMEVKHGRERNILVVGTNGRVHGSRFDLKTATTKSVLKCRRVPRPTQAQLIDPVWDSYAVYKVFRL